MDNPVQVYTGTNHWLGRGIHVAFTNQPVRLRRGDQEWLVEWHRYFGPILLNKTTQEPRKTQPGETSWFWLVAQWWKDQGCRVVDGVGVWDEPPVVEVRYTKLRGKWVANANGELVKRYWQGYERLGEARSNGRRV